MDKRRCSYCRSDTKVVNFDRKIPLCSKHYSEIRRHGYIDPMRERSNVIKYKDDCIQIIFKDGSVGVFDKEDEVLINKATWGLDVHGYIHGKVNGELARYHRHLFGFPDKVIDHINRNKLDNRKSNLRLCTPKDNSRNLSIAKNNTSGVTGVRKTKYNKWNVRITVDRKEVHIGNFDGIEEAIRARKEAENKYFGEYAPINTGKPD